MTSGMELTGTSDARMFALLATTPTLVAELDPKTGKSLRQIPVPEADIGTGFAFAHWGGALWLFTAPGGTTIVTKVSLADGKADIVKRDLGFAIIGAGVSTCAPTMLR